MRTILVIEDNVITLKTLCLILSRAGYAAIPATTPEEAEERFRGSAVDLVIVDHGLPGITGSELAQKLREIKCVLVLMLTGNPDVVGKPDSVDLLLLKPMSVPTLLAEIEGLFAGGKSDAPETGSSLV